jgi:hypothetical protein
MRPPDRSDLACRCYRPLTSRSCRAASSALTSGHRQAGFGAFDEPAPRLPAVIAQADDGVAAVLPVRKKAGLLRARLEVLAM